MSQSLSCREILAKLSEYIDEELDPRICDEIDSHMSGCAPCVAFLNTLKKTAKLFRATKDGSQIPPAVQEDLHRFLRDKCGGAR